MGLVLAHCGLADAQTDFAEQRRHRLHWQFPRFRAWEYVSNVVVSEADVYLEYGMRPFPDQRFNGPLPLDEEVRDAVRAKTENGRGDASRLSYLFWHPVQYFPVLIDSLYVPLVLDDLNVDVAWQMTMIDWQALGLAFFATRLAHVTVGRARPTQYGCSEDPTARKPCIHDGPAFFSGHTSMAAAGAGLTCAHHAAIPLYGGGWPDTAICVVMSSAAALNGYLRMRADDHWFSDVVAGYVIGWGIGFGVPWLLHYGHKERTLPLGAGLLPRGFAIVPLPFEGGAGVGLTSTM